MEFLRTQNEQTWSQETFTLNNKPKLDDQLKQTMNFLSTDEALLIKSSHYVNFKTR